MEVYSYLLFQNKINIAKLWKQPEEKGANRELIHTHFLPGKF